MGSNLTLTKKVLAGVGTLALLLAVLGAGALYQSWNSERSRHDLIHVQVKRMELAATIDAATQAMTANQRLILLSTVFRDAGQMEAAKKQFRDHTAVVEKSFANLQQLTPDEAARQALGREAEQVRAWRSVFDEIARLCMSEQFDVAYKMRSEKAVPISQAILAAAAKLLEEERRVVAAADAAAAGSARNGRILVIGLLVLALPVAAAIFWGMRGATTRLQHVAEDINQSAEQVANAARQVASASQTVAQGASRQASSLEETSASSEEVNAMSRKNADSSGSAAALMQESAALVGRAESSLAEMVASMLEINQQSEKISRIIKVIEEIAFQTNILALNAAVEAARAGDAGMGFAVVAEEVRSLARRSAQAAKDTASLIEESIAKSGEGRTKLDQVTVAVQSIIENADKVKVLVAEISAGSQEQARGIEQIARAISQMEQETQKTAAGAEEGASAGEELTAQSESMRSLAAGLKSLVG